MLNPSTSPTSSQDVLAASLEGFCQGVLAQGRVSLTLRFTLSAFQHGTGNYKYAKGGIWAVELQVAPGSGAELARRIEGHMVAVQKLLVSGL